MKQLDRMAEEYATEDPELGLWNEDKREGFKAGFLKARKMAAKVSSNHPNDPDHAPYGFCNVCGGGPEIAKQIETVGEEEV